MFGNVIQGVIIFVFIAATTVHSYGLSSLGATAQYACSKLRSGSGRSQHIAATLFVAKHDAPPMDQRRRRLVQLFAADGHDGVHSSRSHGGGTGGGGGSVDTRPKEPAAGPAAGATGAAGAGAAGAADAMGGGGIRRRPTPPAKVVPSPEEKLNLVTSIDTCGFLKNIQEYGNNRMARRAVGVLQKMPAYRVYPQQEHYTEVIIACEKSDMYRLAVGVFEEMLSLQMEPTAATYAALISVAEKTDHYDEAVRFFHQMIERGIEGCLESYNAVLVAYEKLGDFEAAIALIQTMKQRGVAPDVVSYTACCWACEQSCEGLRALEVIDQMVADGIPMTTKTCNAVLWANVKAGITPAVFKFYNRMEAYNVPKDASTYNAMIWASEMEGDVEHAVKFLRLMKFDKIPREIMSFDGALSAANKADDLKLMLDMMRWIDQDGVPRSAYTYMTMIDALDRNREHNKAEEIYYAALLDGFFSPWVPKTRKMDLRGFPLSMAKVALKTVLISMVDGRQPLFRLSMVVGDVAPNGDESSSFDPDLLADFLFNLSLQETFPGAHAPATLTIGADHSVEHRLESKRSTVDGLMLLTIELETLRLWMADIE